MRGRLSILLAVAALAAPGALAACGEDEEEPAISAEGGETGSCTPIEEVPVESFGNHSNRDFTAADYETNPPAGGDHSPAPLQGGQFHPRPQRLGEAVHLLEHGGVIGWTNQLDTADRKAVEDEFNRAFAEGYYELAVVENPELEVPFALSAWGFLQRCEEPDGSVIGPFIEQHYAPSTSGESSLACQGEARRLAPCRAPQ